VQTNDPLDHLLQQLAGMTERAQQIWEEEYRADEDNEVDDDTVFDFDGEHRMWLGLEQDVNGLWACGWLMRPDEATEFVLAAHGRTPQAAAQALLEDIVESTEKEPEPTSNPDVAPTPDSPF
jgi:hypothetical protein